MSYCAPLFYLDHDAYQPLPSWGQFFITLGADIYETLDPDRRLVVAIAVPTRAYAAVLLALGVIANGSGAGNDAAHVDQISELVIDTPVFLFKEQTDGMHRAKGLYKCQWPHKSRHWWPSCACSLEGRWASSCSLKNKFSLSQHGLRVGGAWGTVGRFSTNGDH